MGTLSSELAPHAERLSPQPRIYADANVPAGLVAYMRARLGWDVLFVIEEDELRRAPDVEALPPGPAACGGRCVTLDRDYLDDRRFPPAEGRGVLVLSAPDERQLRAARAHRSRAVPRRSEPGGAAARRSSYRWLGRSADRAILDCGAGAIASARSPKLPARRLPSRPSIVLSAPQLVLPDRVLSPGTLVIDGGRISEIRPGAPHRRATALRFHAHYIVPGFIDVHVHGVEGVDTLDDGESRCGHGGAAAAATA